MTTPTGFTAVTACHQGGHSEHVAEVLIAALGMREQTGNNAAYPQVVPCADYLRTHHRYITEWKADD